MNDKSGVILTAALMIIAALSGNEEDIKMAKNINAENMVKLANKYYEPAQKLVKLIAKNWIEENVKEIA